MTRIRMLGETLSDYIAFRTQELDHEEAELAQRATQGIGTGLPRREAINRARWVLSELAKLNEWLAKGEPVFQAPLSAEEKDFWRKAKARGVEVPGDIEAQL